MAITRVICTYPFYSGVPEDAATNTFYFASVAEPTSVDCAAIATRLEAFYANIDIYMSPVFLAGAATAKFYKMSDPTPRTPFITLPLASLVTGASGLPEEVAACLSYSAVAVSGQSAARRRGRVYIGPLATTVVSGGSTSAFTALLPAFRTALASSAAALADQSEAFQWAVYSPTDLVARQIVGGWVDNAFDTQRRRGRRATARLTWTGQA